MTNDKKYHKSLAPAAIDYDSMLSGVAGLLEQARRASARAVNTIMTATYWEIGRRIVEYEQKGAARAEYGSALLNRLSTDLSVRFGRGFSERNLKQMRLFYTGWQIRQTVSAEFRLQAIADSFPLPWSHYVRLMSVDKSEARSFYEAEALRGGWTVRQLTARFPRFSMNVPPFPATRQPC